MTLGFRANQYTLPLPASGISEVYAAITGQQGLPGLGFTDVSLEQEHVHGARAGYGVDVFFLPITDRVFWEVVLCDGPAQPVADSIMASVVTMIANFAFWK